ncbi:MAG: hypothetical protein JWR78_4405 [Mycobacterium sp.]|nr:hypothetical protein [Mycobacterium sp.]
MTSYRRADDGKILNEEQMRDRWSEDISSLDEKKVDQEDQQSYRGWLVDMLVWGRFSEVDEE